MTSLLPIQLPSGRTDVTIGRLLTSDMALLHNACQYELAPQFVQAIQRIVNVNLMDMLEEDFKYLLAWVDKTSYPDALRNYNWRCVKPYWADANNVVVFNDPNSVKFKKFECLKLNSEQVRDMSVIQTKMHTLPSNMHWPTVREWVESVEAQDQGFDPRVVEVAKWWNSDKRVEDRIQDITFRESVQVRAYIDSKVQVKLKLKCNFCGRVYEHTQPLKLFKFLRTYSPTSIMDMAWNLTSYLESYIPDDVPLVKFLYWHSCYVKDKNEMEEKRRIQEAARKTAQIALRRGAR